VNFKDSKPFEILNIVMLWW